MGRTVMPENYHVFDSGYRGNCNYEDDDAASFYLWVALHHPKVNIFHVANESGFSSSAGHIEKRRRKGVRQGVSDYIILTPSRGYGFAVIESKRRDRTKSKWQEGQREFLNQCSSDGGFAAVCYGLEEMKKAFNFYLHG